MHPTTLPADRTEAAATPAAARPSATGSGAAAMAAAVEAARLADLDPGRAGPVAERAAAMAVAAGDVEAAAVARRAWGHALMHCGEMDAAIRQLRRSVADARGAGLDALSGQSGMKLAHALVQRGRPRAALATVEEALLVLDGVDDTSAARATAQRAIILHQMGRLDEAAAGFDAALPRLRAADDLLGIQRMLINRAFLHTDRSAFALATADLTEAERLARRLGRDLTIGIVAANLGYVETRRGDVPAALAHFDRAERIMAEHGAQLGTIHQDRSELLLSVGLVSEAGAAARQAVAAYRTERRLLKVPEARLLLAQVAMLDADWPAALEQAGRAARELAAQHRQEWASLGRLLRLRIRLAAGLPAGASATTMDAIVDTLTRTGWPLAALEARLVAGRLALRRGDGPTALAHFADAGRTRRSGPATVRARGWYAQALLRLHGGDPRGAGGAARTGLRILDEHAAAMGATDLRAHSAVHRTELAALGLRIALDSPTAGRAARVLEWAERGRASRLRHRPARPPDDPELARLLSQLRAALGAGATGRQVALERAIRDHSRRRPGTPDGPPPRPVTPSRLASALGGCALVEFVLLDGHLHGLTLASGRLRLRPLGPAAEVTDLVARLPFALHRLASPRHARGGGRADTRAAALALLRGAVARLDTVLLTPLAAELGDRPLVVVPTGPLHGVPWSTLPSCVGRPLSVSPSATLWHAITTRATGAGPGATAAEGGVPAPGRVVVAAGPRLPGAREEALAVAAVHGTTALVGEAATSSAVLAAMGDAGLAHLATHGRLSADNPLFSDLLLADGPLVVHDLEQLPRAPHTVVLAACDSGRSVVRTGDELLGLSAALVARGTAQLVASVVPVPDAETAPLMVAFHRGLAAGRSPAAALADAQVSLRDGDPAALAAAAGFVCLGAGHHPA